LAVLLIVVFFAVRALTRDQLQVRVAAAADVQLVSTISTNGRVEPEVNFEVHSPIATTVKAVYVQPGDQVAAGKVLLVLDDVEARAREATAESGVRAAQAALEAATQNGTQQERQATAADVLRQRLERDNARRDLDALTKLNSTGAASSSEVAAARQRLDTAEVNLRALDQSQNSRYSHAETERARAALGGRGSQPSGDAAGGGANCGARSGGGDRSIAWIAGATDFVEEGKLLLQLADLHRERVRAYFDEPELGALQLARRFKSNGRQAGRIWNGHIERTPVTVINLGTRSVGEVLVKIDDVDGDLLPDTNVTVTVTLSSEPNSLSVPREALRLENGKPYVFKVVKDGLQRTYVTTGTINLTQVAILSGLVNGDLVATGTLSGQPLQEGVPIKVVR
jgi:HlyD family secretion protein